jgi:hypothetical protein
MRVPCAPEEGRTSPASPSSTLAPRSAGARPVILNSTSARSALDAVANADGNYDRGRMPFRMASSVGGDRPASSANTGHDSRAPGGVRHQRAASSGQLRQRYLPRHRRTGGGPWRGGPRRPSLLFFPPLQEQSCHHRSIPCALRHPISVPLVRSSSSTSAPLLAPPFRSSTSAAAGMGTARRRHEFRAGAPAVHTKYAKAELRLEVFQ